MFVALHAFLYELGGMHLCYILRATQDALQCRIAAQGRQDKMELQQKQQQLTQPSSSIASAPAHVKPGRVQQVNLCFKRGMARMQ